jgi:hypothetical protein
MNITKLLSGVSIHIATSFSDDKRQSLFILANKLTGSNALSSNSTVYTSRIENNRYSRITIVPSSWRDTKEKLVKLCQAKGVPLLQEEFLLYIDAHNKVPSLSNLSRFCYWLPNSLTDQPSRKKQKTLFDCL